MSYVVLARKYRPQSFEDLVGQKPVSQTLSNALSSGRVAHAYIFSGPRGVGKTTTARVLAKCLNCQSGPTVTPCNTCESCTTIAQGTSVDDVLEIDGASNRGIEQIRELRENAKYRPSKNRYRVYIIDEAHQITKDAFGALLKTLEEPPSHVVFMMATTEVFKIPAPILSRCQRFSLRPIAPDLIFDHLKNICKKEKINVEDDALKNIVRFVEGSLRDALSLLDQAIVFSPDNITSKSLRELLGLLPFEVVLKTAQDIQAGDPATILKTITDSIKNGIDLSQLAKDLQSYYHTLLLYKANVNDPLLTNDSNRKEEADATTFETLERNIRLLSRAMEEMRRSETPRAIFEITALKLGQKTLDPRALIERLEQLEKNGTVSFTSKIQETGNKPTVKPRVEASKPPIGFSPTPPVPQSPSPAVPSGLGLKIQSQWPKVVESISENKQTLGAALKECALSVNNGNITLKFSTAFNEELVKRNEELIKSTLSSRIGEAPVIKTQVDPTIQPKMKSTKQSGPSSSFHMPTNDVPAQFEEVKTEEVGADIKKAIQFFPGTLKRQGKEA